MDLQNLYRKKTLIDQLYAHFSVSATEMVFLNVMHHGKALNPCLRCYIAELTATLNGDTKRLRFELNAALLLA
jgi:hypothetical protein